VRLAEEGSDIIGVDVCGEVGDTGRFYPPATKEDLAENPGGRVISHKLTPAGADGRAFPSNDICR